MCRVEHWRPAWALLAFVHIQILDELAQPGAHPELGQCRSVLRSPRRSSVLNRSVGHVWRPVRSKTQVYRDPSFLKLGNLNVFVLH